MGFGSGAAVIMKRYYHRSMATGVPDDINMHPQRIIIKPQE